MAHSASSTIARNRVIPCAWTNASGSFPSARRSGATTRRDGASLDRLIAATALEMPSRPGASLSKASTTASKPSLRSLVTTLGCTRAPPTAATFGNPSDRSLCTSIRPSRSRSPCRSAGAKRSTSDRPYGGSPDRVGPRGIDSALTSPSLGANAPIGFESFPARRARPGRAARAIGRLRGGRSALFRAPSNPRVRARSW